MTLTKVSDPYSDVTPSSPYRTVAGNGPRMWLAGGGYMGQNGNSIVSSMIGYVDMWFSTDGLSWHQVGYLGDDRKKTTWSAGHLVVVMWANVFANRHAPRTWYKSRCFPGVVATQLTVRGIKCTSILCISRHGKSRPMARSLVNTV